MNRLKDLISKALVLKFFDDEKEIIVAADASKYAIEGVLLQKGYPEI